MQTLFAYADDWNNYTGLEMNYTGLEMNYTELEMNCTQHCAHTLSSLDEAFSPLNRDMSVVTRLSIIAGLVLVISVSLSSGFSFCFLESRDFDDD